jgi:CubicO group peptidase (beta-lactamase class C family)
MPSNRNDRLVQPILGNWLGVVEFPVINFRREIFVTFSGSDEARATVDIPDSRTFGLPLEKIEGGDGNVRFAMLTPRGQLSYFDGIVAGDRVAGQVTDPRLDAPGSFVLTRDNNLSYRSEGNMSWAPMHRHFWPTQRWQEPTSEEFDVSSLDEADQRILEHQPQVRSLLVVHNGKLVYEKYYRGASPDDAYNIKSVSKSFISALVGIALDQHILRSLDQPIAEFLPEYFTPQTDPRKLRVTLRDLLTMTAGFEWEENGPITAQWARSEDCAKFVIESELVHEPGSVFNYSTAVSHLMAIILERASGMSALEFAEKHLFKQTGITVRRWERDPRGHYVGGSEMYMTARDLARFGFLFLNQGQWDEEQILSKEWVLQSTRRQSAGEPMAASYGYYWWLGQDHGFPVFFAQGYGGQVIYVVPDLDLVVVLLSTTETGGGGLRELISDYIVPVVQGLKHRPP